MPYITKEIFYNQENQQRAAQLLDEIKSYFFSHGLVERNLFTVTAYVLWKASQHDKTSGITLKAIIDDFEQENDSLYLFIKNRMLEEHLESVVHLTEKYSFVDFALAVLLPLGENESRVEIGATPESIIKLVHKLLDVKAGESVADLCCGTGSYLVSAALKENKALYSGYEISVAGSLIAQLRAELLEADVDVTVTDVFSLAEPSQKVKFDKIFANYPFGLRLKNLEISTDYIKSLSQKFPGLMRATSSDWIFNALLCDLIKEDGKAIGIMTNGSTWNSIDMPIRKYFIESKMVECVISLPPRMFVYTGISTTLIILSRNNETVRMIDAEKLCQQGRRQNEFSDNDISAIVNAVTVDTEYSKTVTIEELRRQEYALNFSRYVEGYNLSFENGVPFGSIMKRITRGAPCTAKELDEMISDTVTDMQYLMLSNIQNGMIDDKLPYLSSISSNYERYCLKNNSLILSKNSYPYKVAVVSVKEGQKILANGNLFIIELDEEKANPYYVKAFLDSEQGYAVLKSITAGSTIPNIAVDKLRTVEIPLPSMEEQNRIAQKYQATLDEISVLKLRLEKAINKLHCIYGEEDK